MHISLNFHFHCPCLFDIYFRNGFRLRFRKWRTNVPLYGLLSCWTKTANSFNFKETLFHTPGIRILKDRASNNSVRNRFERITFYLNLFM